MSIELKESKDSSMYAIWRIELRLENNVGGSAVDNVRWGYGDAVSVERAE